MIVYPTKVVRPSTGRIYIVPKLEGQLSINYLRVLAQYVAAPNIYFGTGQGEWGGHLVRLDTDTGEWVYYYDSLHYVTGITQAKPNELIVSWSMSHFMADTLVRVHNQDMSVKQEYPELDSKYIQSIAYEQTRGLLYGIEQNDVVEINQGMPRRITSLGKLPYGIEPNAIGVAPGILTLLPVKDGSLIIVHRNATPMVLQNRKLRLFSVVDK